MSDPVRLTEAMLEHAKDMVHEWSMWPIESDGAVVEAMSNMELLLDHIAAQDRHLAEARAELDASRDAAERVYDLLGELHEQENHGIGALGVSPCVAGCLACQAQEALYDLATQREE